MRSKAGGEGQGSKGGIGESVKGVTISVTPLFVAVIGKIMEFYTHKSIRFLPIDELYFTIQNLICIIKEKGDGEIRRLR